MADTPLSPQDERTIARAHPLAEALVRRLLSQGRVRVLDFAAGSGRNGAAMRRAGLQVVSLDDERAASALPLAGLPGRFAAAVTTHGLLHGTPRAIEARLDAIADALEDGAPLYATFGSTKDARFGAGRRLDRWTYAPVDGDERGVAHAYFEREPLVALLERRFVVESLEERGVDRIAGAWAHRTAALAGSLHWFAIVAKRPASA